MTRLDYESIPTGAAEQNRSARQIIALLLAFLGVGFVFFGQYVWVDKPRLVWPDWRVHLAVGVILLLAATICAIPAARTRLAAGLDRLRAPSDRNRRLWTIAIWMATTLYLYLTALWQGRDLAQHSQDEMMYLVQIQQAAKGHLWMAGHPLADFFQSYYLFVKPVYAGMHFPGVAVIYAPTVWLGMPAWVLSLILSGALVAMTYRVVTELIDGAAGALAALLLLGLGNFRWLSVMVMPYVPMSLLILLMLWGYLHWRRKHALGWTAAIGLMLGLGAILRPVDVICFGTPIVAMMLWEMRTDGWKKNVVRVLVAGLCCAPFVAAQLAVDKGVTGHYLTSPLQHYYKTFWPAVKMGMPSTILKGKFPSATDLPQFKENYDEFIVPTLQHNREIHGLGIRYAQSLNWGLPTLWLVVLVMLGLMGLWRGRRSMWGVGLLIMPLAYLMVFYVPLYAVLLAPGLMFLVVLGIEQVKETFPAARKFVGPWLFLAVAGIALAGFPEFGLVRDKTTNSPPQRAFLDAAKTIQKPALVFFQYHPGVKNLWRHEQTYNFETAAIDDASIVRAHDLGERNIELIRYYARMGQDRMVYRFDQVSKELTPLGKISELAK